MTPSPVAETPLSSPTGEASLTPTSTAAPGEVETLSTQSSAPEAASTLQGQVDNQDPGELPASSSSPPDCENPPCESPLQSESASGTLESDSPEGNIEPPDPQAAPPQPATPVVTLQDDFIDTASQSSASREGLGPNWLLAIGVVLIAIGAIGLLVQRRRRS